MALNRLRSRALLFEGYQGITDASMAVLEASLNKYTASLAPRWEVLAKVRIAVRRPPNPRTYWPSGFVQPYDVRSVTKSPYSKTIIHVKLPRNIPSTAAFLRFEHRPLTFGLAPVREAIALTYWHEITHCLHLYRYFRRFDPLHWSDATWEAKVETVTRRLQSRLAHPSDVDHVAQLVASALHSHRVWEWKVLLARSDSR